MYSRFACYTDAMRNLDKPHFGRTRSGKPVHARTYDHLPHDSAVQRFNTRLAVIITKVVGSMWCAYAFAALALYGLPAALKPGGEGLVSWIAQTFLQLVLLSIIIVGQDVQSKASDARAAKTFEDIELVVDRLNTKTDGGLTEVLAAIRQIKGGSSTPSGTTVMPCVQEQQS